MKLGFIGTGQIAKATILGILESNLKINKIYISQRNKKISKQLSKKNKKIKKVMHEFKLGKLKSGKSKKKVVKKEQAIAIAISEANKKRKKNLTHFFV